MYYIVYQITNKINGHIYVGVHQTNNIDDGYMGSGGGIRRAIKEYGISNFSKKVLAYTESVEQMFAKEAEIVNHKFIARHDTYNKILGGMGGLDHINLAGLNIYPDHAITARKNILKGSERMHYKLENDPEFRKEYGEKMSTVLKERYSRIPHQWTGRNHRTETKQKIGEKAKIHQLGSRNSQSGTCWVYDIEGKNRKIPLSDLKMYLEQGYTRGRKY